MLQGPFQFLTNKKKIHIHTHKTNTLSSPNQSGQTHHQKNLKKKKNEEEGSKNVYIHTELKLPSSFIIIRNDSQSLLNKNFSLIHKTWASKC